MSRQKHPDAVPPSLILIRAGKVIMGNAAEVKKSVTSSARDFRDDDPWRTLIPLEMDRKVVFLMSRCERSLMVVESVPSSVTILPRTSLRNAEVLNLTIV